MGVPEPLKKREKKIISKSNASVRYGTIYHFRYSSPSQKSSTATGKSRMSKIFAFVLLISASAVTALIRPQTTTRLLNHHIKHTRSSSIDNDGRFGDRNIATTDNISPSVAISSLLLPAAASLFPLSCSASEGVTQLPSAFAAYGHYLAIILVAVSLTAERLLIKPNMSSEDEELLAKADILYGLAGTLVTVTGYYRVTAYGKGWEFYSHEPIFWFKLLLFAVIGASSFFPTIKIIQRAVHAQNFKDGKRPDAPLPMSEKLANRMTKIVNGELLAVLSVPLTASLMSRGVGYMEGLPWQAGAAPVGLALTGLGYKYVKEALDWKEDA